MTRVDRTADAALHFDYGVQKQDPPEGEEITVDEVDDGRRHQFIATCRQRERPRGLPDWLSQADVDAADQKNLLEEVEPITADDILDTAAFWDACFVPDHRRRRPLAHRSRHGGDGLRLEHDGHPRGHVHDPRLYVGTRSSTCGWRGRAW